MPDRTHHVYIRASAGRVLYVGSTSHLTRRLAEHRAGKLRHFDNICQQGRSARQHNPGIHTTPISRTVDFLVDQLQLVLLHGLRGRARTIIQAALCNVVRIVRLAR